MFFFILIGYLVTSLTLFFYSYTQVDLSLTLSQISVWQTIQKSFQYIGYYQRPLSTWLYLAILLLLYSFYGFLLLAVKKKRINVHQLWKIIFVVAVILTFSYPAFSYDIFNYMFDAKTVLVYHKIPYMVIPQQFTGVEPWLSFLHWTHVPSIFSPFWIVLTLLPYLLGFGYFLLILWNIKILLAFCYLLSVWAIGAILRSVEKGYDVMGMAIFALNPLIIIESLVSGHNDVVMMAFALVAFVFSINKNVFGSFFFLATSIATKLVTAMLLPLYVLQWRRGVALLLMTGGLVGFLSFTHREIQPWYWLWVMPFIAILPRRFNLVILSGGVSLGLLLRYAPFLYFGHWNPPVPFIKDGATFISIGGAFLVVGILQALKH